MKHLAVSLLVLVAALVGRWRAQEPETEPASEPREQPARPAKAKKAPKASAPGPAGLTMPRPEPCIELTGDGLGDQGMVASAGLERAQVKSALDAVLPHALGCGTEGSFNPTFELVIGCDGVMSRVTVSDGDGAPPQVLDCIAQVLKHADFPAHDMPDGMTVPYPVSVSF